MECVILWRNTQSGKIGFVSEGDGDEIAVFKNFDDAVNAADSTTVCKHFPFQIVECNEL